MLSIVDIQIATAERVSQAAQVRPGLDERHRVTGIHAAQRRRDPGQPTADDHDAGSLPPPTHQPRPLNARAATPAFCQPDNDRRRSNTIDGRAEMRPSNR